MAAFQWDVTGPFTVEPMNGILEPKTTCAIHATFHPKVNKYHSYLFNLAISKNSVIM